MNDSIKVVIQAIYIPRSPVMEFGHGPQPVHFSPSQIPDASFDVWSSGLALRGNETLTQDEAKELMALTEKIEQRIYDKHAGAQR